MLARTQYEHLVHTLPVSYPSIRSSTLILTPPGLNTARLAGLVAFNDNPVLCVYELMNFQQGLIETHRHEVSRCHSPFAASPLPEATEYCRASYPGKEKLCWYDSWPHSTIRRWQSHIRTTSTFRPTSNTTGSRRLG